MTERITTNGNFKELSLQDTNETLLKILKFEEGYRLKPYYDSEGYPTIGIGIKIGKRNAPLSFYQFTCPLKVAFVWLDEYVIELNKRIQASERTQKAWIHCNNARRAILISMAYQLGFHGLCKFKRMIKSIEKDDWEMVKVEALNSLWARQTPFRAERHASVLLTGTFGIYKDLLN